MGALVNSVNIVMGDMATDLARKFFRKVREYVRAYGAEGATLESIAEAVGAYKSPRRVFQRTMDGLVEKAGMELTEEEQARVEKLRMRRLLADRAKQERAREEIERRRRRELELKLEGNGKKAIKSRAVQAEGAATHNVLQVLRQEKKAAAALQKKTKEAENGSESVQ